ncbi:MAG: hypothetical protein V4598_04360 [Bdellovibrionota bacterium]
MNAETTWNDEVEAVDLELIAALEREITDGKSKLARLSADDEDIFH